MQQQSPSSSREHSILAPLTNNSNISGKLASNARVDQLTAVTSISYCISNLFSTSSRVNHVVLNLFRNNCYIVTKCPNTVDIVLVIVSTDKTFTCFPVGYFEIC